VPPPQGAHHARYHPTDLHSMLDTLPRRPPPGSNILCDVVDSPKVCYVGLTGPPRSRVELHHDPTDTCTPPRVVLPVWVSQPTRRAPYRVVGLSSPPWFINDRPSSTCSLAASSMVRRGATWYSRGYAGAERF
jgi:hypothetical protein